MRLRTGAEMRVTGPADASAAVVCVNGGQGGEVAGTWSATLEWLVRGLGPRFPRLTFGEVKYRVKSWRRLEWCVDDARAAVETLAAPRTLLLGFSMGGAVAIRAAGEPSVETVLGLAPWIPVLHGTLDRSLPGIPGVSPAASRRGFDRAQALGVVGEYTLVRGALHGVALRVRRGRPVPLPRAAVWARLVGDELARFQAGPEGT